MHVAMKGPTGAFLDGLKTPNCVRSVDGVWDTESEQYVGEASYQYERRACVKTSGVGSKDLVQRTGSNGNKLAEGLVVGAWWGLSWQRFGAVRWCEVQLVCCKCCMGFP